MVGFHFNEVREKLRQLPDGALLYVYLLPIIPRKDLEKKAGELGMSKSVTRQVAEVKRILKANNCIQVSEPTDTGNMQARINLAAYDQLAETGRCVIATVDAVKRFSK